MKALILSIAMVVLGALGAGGYLLWVGDGPDPLTALVVDAPGTDPAPSMSSQTAAPAPKAEADRVASSGTPVGDPNPLRFGVPIDCTIGRDCVIQNFVDMAPGADYRDYRCGPLSYNAHTGTDFRLPSHREMEAGVDVVAAAGGTVTRIREGMPDVNFRLVGREAVTDQGLGNVVLIEHKDGFVSAYAHLKRGSITVQPGDTVAPGQVLGQVGLSGLTEFPHLHFEVRRNNQVIDPFTGRPADSGCGPAQTPLWSAAALERLLYIPTLVVRIGFADRTLNRAAVEYGLLVGDGGLSRRAENLLMHVYLSGLRAGDIARFQILGPDGVAVLNSERVIARDAAVQLLRAGAMRRAQPWPSGLYKGIFTLQRDRAGVAVEAVRAEAEVAIR